MEAAPYFDDVASGPPGGAAYWTRGADGVRVRVGVWPGGSRGTVLIFPGRTEYIEKYSDAARHLTEGGYSVATIDWRGQGLTERPRHNRRVGHVRDFRDFQLDVDAMLEVCSRLELPRPYHLLGHSMGGLIGLRSLMDRPVFDRAVFSAPMWGLPLPAHKRLAAWSLCSLATGLGLGTWMTPGSGKVSDPVAAPFEGNLLTNDPEMFAWMKTQVATYPDLALGAPSMNWVWAAMREMHVLARRAAPDCPTRILLGTHEQIVDADAIHVRAASWKGAQVLMQDGLQHEPLMEDAVTRARLYGLILDHLGAGAPHGAAFRPGLDRAFAR